MFKWPNSTPSIKNRFTKARKLNRAVRCVLESLEPKTLFSFTAPVPYAANPGAIAMTTIDLNHDGHLDVVSTNPGVVTTMLGNGDGTFQPALTTPIGVTPGSAFTGAQSGTLATGDINGDGNIDIVTEAGSSAYILFGNGDGTFQPVVSTALGQAPARLTVADLNNDGRADIAIANAQGFVNVVLSGPNNTFAAPTMYAAGASPQDVKAVDMNHDGKPDLVVANGVSFGTVTILRGNGDGSFQPGYSTYANSAPFRLEVDDVDNDGNPDVIVANSYTSSLITVLKSNPDGSLQPAKAYDSGSQPWELHLGDIDGDGKDDLISANGNTYQVEMNNGDGTFGPTTTLQNGGSAFAAGDFNGDGSADIAAASVSNINVLINNASSASNISTAVGFVVSAPTNATVGTQFPITISAVDASGKPVPDFLGTVHITSSDPRASAMSYTFTAADQGVHTITNYAFFTTGADSIAVNGLKLQPGSATVNVTAAPATRFVVSQDGAAVAGTPISFTVTAYDYFGNLADAYTGTVAFVSSDPHATLAANYTFTPDDHGSHIFSATLRTVGSQNISAYDVSLAQSTMVAGSTLVAPAAVNSIAIVGGGGHIGSPHTVTVTALDPFGNIASGYSGTLNISASDPNALVPATATVTNGVGSFTMTPMTLGTQTITAADASNPALAAAERITGVPGDAVRFTVTPISGAVAGTSQLFTVTAYDAFGNIQPDYAGVVTLTSSDPQASVFSYAFSPVDVGSHTFSVTLRTAGSQSITVSDIAHPNIAPYTQNGILITPAAAATMSVTPLSGGVAGVAQSFTVKAKDIYGNVATDFRDTISFSSSDTKAALPATYTFTAADAGTHTFTMAFKTAGGQTFTVTDANNPARTYFQQDINIVASTMAGFSLVVPSNVTAGAAFSLKVVAVDAFGNTVTNYTGTVHISGPAGSILPPNYTFTAADGGVHLFTVTLNTAGSQSLAVTDTLASTLIGNTLINVKSSGGGSGGGGVTSGGGGGGGGTTTGGGGGGGKKVA